MPGRFKYLLVLLVAFSGCILPKFPQVRDIDNFRIVKNADSTAVALIDVWVYNPNYFGFTLKSLVYTARVKKQFLGYGVIDSTVKFPAKTDVLLKDQRVFIKYADLDTILKSVPRIDSLPVTFDLKARLKPLFFPVYWRKTINLNTADALAALINWDNIALFLKIRGIKILSVQPKQTRMLFTFDFVNPYPVSLTIDEVNLKIYDKYNNFLGSTSLAGVAIKANSVTRLPFEVRIDNVLFAVSLLGQYIDEDMIFYAQGKMKITLNNTQFVLPVKEKISIRIEHE